MTADPRTATALTTNVPGIASANKDKAATVSKLKRSGKDMAAWQAEVWPAAVKAAEPYPHLRALYAANSNADLEAGSEDNFSYGLARTLDGLEARLRRR
jgi:hypothetical protein